jgi:hypothetical protein
MSAFTFHIFDSASFAYISPMASLGVTMEEHIPRRRCDREQLFLDLSSFIKDTTMCKVL